jgi:TP53 regulating kinase and related kinases
MSNHVEDKAVDLYVLKRALISTNPECQASWSAILNSYKNEATKSDVTIKRYEEVERRGRKRIAFG